MSLTVDSISTASSSSSPAIPVKVIPLQHPDSTSSDPRRHSIPFHDYFSQWTVKIKRMTFFDWIDTIFPCFLWIRTYRWHQYFKLDLMAGITNALLEFARVVKAKEQVVAGTLHHLTLEILEAGEKKLYEAKVWVKPWLNFKELQEFKPASDAPAITPSDLGCKKDEHGSGWREVPGDDPEVQHVAEHAVKTIQQRSNSLFPYQLQEVVHANAEVTGEAAKFNLLLKLKRGEKEEKKVQGGSSQEP